MRYELWTTSAGDIVDEFASEAEALACVREMIEGMPANAAESLLLGIVRDDGRRELIATGDALRDRAFASGAARRSG